MADNTIIKPDDEFFGPLHNNYDQDIYIDDKKYRSISNYIYSNLIQSPGPKESFRNAKPSNLKYDYEKIYREYKDTIVFESMKKAADILYNTNSQMADLLVSTGNSVLIYNNKKNSYLGIGKEGKGKNQYGNYLMTLRSIVKSQQEIYKDIEELKIKYSIYSVYSYLSKLILSKNYPRDDLLTFKDMSWEKILKNYKNNIERFKIMDFETFINVWKNDLFPDKDTKQIINNEYLRPGIIPSYLRSKYIVSYNTQTLENMKETLLKQYIKSVIIKKHSEVSNPDLQADKQFYGLSSEQRQNLEERVYRLYNSGILKVDEDIVIYTPLSVEEVQTIRKEFKENYNLEKLSQELETKTEKKEVYDNDTIIKFWKYKKDEEFSRLSPSCYNGMITIEGYPYNTVETYIMFSLIKSLPGINFTQARSLLYKDPSKDLRSNDNFKTSDELLSTFLQMEKTLYEEYKLSLLEKGLREKFKDDRLKQLLVSTKGNIIYEDNLDLFLGTSEKEKGANMMGILLEELRKTYESEGVEELKLEKKIQTFENLVRGNRELDKWIKGKIEDLVRTTLKVKEIFEEQGSSIIINKNFVEFIIRNYYIDCLKLFNIDKLENCPEDFKTLLSQYLDLEKRQTGPSIELGEDEKGEGDYDGPSFYKGGDGEEEIVSPCDLIWTYIHGLTRALFRYLIKENINTKETVTKAILSLRKFTITEPLDCSKDIQVYDSKLGDCVIHYIKQQLIILKNYGKSMLGIEINEESKDLVKSLLNILLPKDVDIDYQEIQNSELEEEVLDKLQRVSLSLYPDSGNVVEGVEIAKLIKQFVDGVLSFEDKENIVKTKSRIMLFSR